MACTYANYCMTIVETVHFFRETQLLEYTANFATYEIHMLYKTYEFHMKYI